MVLVKVMAGGMSKMKARQYTQNKNYVVILPVLFTI